MDTEKLDFDWQALAMNSQSELALFLKKTKGSDALVIPGRPRPLDFMAEKPLKERKVLFIDLDRLKRIVEYQVEDQVMAVETGINLKELDAILIENEQWFPVSRPGAHLYDVIASGDGGYLEHGFGGPRHLILGLSVMLSNGETINTGGKVVKNVSGYDLTRLFVGGRSVLGIPLSANLRLQARPQSALTVAAVVDDSSVMAEIASRLMSSQLPLSALEIMSSPLLRLKTDESGRFKERLIKSLMREHLIDCLDRLPEKACVIFAQVLGHSQVIDEVGPLLKALVRDGARESFDERHIPEDPATPLMLQTDALKMRAHEVFLSLSQIRDHIRLLMQSDEPVYYSARPGAGRLKIYLGSDEEKEHSDALASLLKKESETVLQGIKKRLKEKFDPESRFAPV